MDKLIVLCTIIPLFILRRKKYNLTWLQMGITFIAILLSGYLGSKITGYNLRQYSAIIVDTFVLFVLFLIFKKEQLFDYLSLIIALSCSTGKFPCLYYGCCSGRMIDFCGINIQFPSQIVEIVALAVICVVLFLFENSGKYTNRLWPIFMVMYGVERFLADLMREGAKARLYFGLTEGEFGSLIVLLMGLIWLAIYDFRCRKMKTRQLEE